MNRLNKSKKVSLKIGIFFKKNPNLVKALRVFDISFDQYRKALGEDPYVYTATSTSLLAGSLQGSQTK